jgi:SPFH domain / Band 7 family
MRTTSLVLASIIVLTAGCARVETGEVGLRVNFNKTVDSNELMPGSINQVLVGDVLTFKVQEVGVEANDLHPQASDNSTLKDFDVTAIYSINPKSVSDIWTTKNRGFHTVDPEHHGEILLMNKYVQQVLKNASFKAVRPFPALKLNDNRTVIEESIKQHMQQTLAEEHLADSIIIGQIQVRTMLPADTIIDSANALVRATNELNTKTIEVQTAGKEAERINALNANPKAIEYMNAQATMMLAQAALAGKVQTVIIPYDFKGIVNTGK